MEMHIILFRQSSDSDMNRKRISHKRIHVIFVIIGLEILNLVLERILSKDVLSLNKDAVILHGANNHLTDL